MTHVHLIGIGGTGLSAIALVLLESGVTVSGSDRQLSPLAERVRSAGGRVFIGHRPENVQGADLVVRSSAIPDDNLEVQTALASGIPVLKRAEFLGKLMDMVSGRQGIAIAGTHGKTTTTAMIAWMLVALGQDPSYIIGGVSANLGSNAHAGQGPFFVIEADEYDRMFLGLRPQIAVVTNVEHDHPDCYPTPEAFYQAFEEFVGLMPQDGVLVACGDDAGAARLLDSATQEGRRALAYGIGNRPYAYQAGSLSLNQMGGFTFEALCRGRALRVALQVPGEHNVRNALACLAVADVLGLPLTKASQALGQFRGTGRRFEILGEAGGVTVIDDYAHHPTEIRATLAAARARYAGRSLWAVWQPHTYSRTRSLLTDFLAAFEDADHVVVTEVYAARESAPADGFSARQLVSLMQERGSESQPAGAMRVDVHFAPDLTQAGSLLLARLQPGDVVLVLSAGDANQISTQVLEVLQERDRSIIAEE